MLLLTIALFFLFSSPVSAQDTVSPTATPSATIVTPSPIPTISLILNDVPSQSTIDTIFSVKLTLNNAKPNLDYHFKVSGSTGSSISVGPNWVSGYNGPWDQMPTVSTDNNGYAFLLVNLKTPNTGTFELTGKVAESLVHSNSLESTETKSIIIISPSPVPATPTAITPTVATPTAITPSPVAPTVTIKVPTITPIPTIAIIPTEPPLTPIIEPTSSLLSLEPSPTTSEDILGISDIIKVSPTSSPSKSFNGIPANLIATIFIVIGGLLLLAPLVITQVKK